jgi:glutamate formiminotransferase / formiminotetrahydrofolate cyclodeaminase
MQSLVECIPNFSEGRRPEVIRAITDALRSQPGVQVLDVESDADHNRTVVTVVGPTQAMVPALLAAMQVAAAQIDMEQHRGAHPRMGATDVVPFVPLSNVDMAACIELARELGRRAGEDLGIPVYLYEEAATRPDRVNLADIRRGEYEVLKGEIGTDPNRAPDFGPAQMGKAGATVIGARQPLIAFNAYLNTANVEVAKKIARAVRNSDGGLRFVKALGLLVDGQAQVSMNLTNFRRTPMPRVLEMVRREALRYGCNVMRTEIVGLVPRQALLEAAAWYLQLDNYDPSQILENRLTE